MNVWCGLKTTISRVALLRVQLGYVRDSCGHYSWVLAFNRSAQEGFEKHDCVSSAHKPKVRAQTAGSTS